MDVENRLILICGHITYSTTIRRVENKEHVLMDACVIFFN